MTSGHGRCALLCVQSGALTLGHPRGSSPHFSRPCLGAVAISLYLESLCVLSTPQDTGVPSGGGCAAQERVWRGLLASPGPSRREHQVHSAHCHGAPPDSTLRGGHVAQRPPWGLESRPVFRALFVQAQSSRESGPRADPSSSWAGRGVSGPFTCGFLGRHLNPSLALGAAFGQNTELGRVSGADVGGLGRCAECAPQNVGRPVFKAPLSVEGWPRAGSLGEGRGRPFAPAPEQLEQLGSGKQK